MDCNHYYMFEFYEWFVKSKNYEQANGYFVHFEVLIDHVRLCYPSNSNKMFAFCPSHFYDEYRKSNGVFKVIPPYIQFFDESEIQSLCAIVPVHK